MKNGISQRCSAFLINFVEFVGPSPEASQPATVVYGPNPGGFCAQLADELSNPQPAYTKRLMPDVPLLRGRGSLIEKVKQSEPACETRRLHIGSIEHDATTLYPVPSWPPAKVQELDLPRRLGGGRRRFLGSCSR
jgi:hypothetical protein